MALGASFKISLIIRILIFEKPVIYQNKFSTSILVITGILEKTVMTICIYDYNGLEDSNLALNFLERWKESFSKTSSCQNRTLVLNKSILSNSILYHRNF